ncbi:alkaline phytoceramidase [Botryosphaeria dothidea]|uniref:Alkaline phytoceramidase n=1 Tax=Botryosphaeria dothidea TaxID=55169 RepID=A0A8H4N696_9PEZI|nr:alkaline phytoceramidase [Botryosphaeria dothidea]
MNLLRVPYPAEAYRPAWFEPTARSNFCEEDYVVIPYIAEFVNTITNISYVIYAYKGIRRLRGKPDAVLLSLPYVGLAAVGVLSAAFHATITYSGQMADDLSMIIATGFVLHRAYSAGRSAAWTRNFGVALIVSFVVFAAYHCWTDELLVHFLTFLFTTLAIWRKTRILVRERKERRGDAARLWRLRILVRVGALSAIVGYALWNVDMHLCGYLIGIRRVVGQPWGYLLELHAWWHVLTAIGAYVFMAVVEFLTTEEEEEGRAFAWPVEPYLGKTHDEKRD